MHDPNDVHRSACVHADHGSLAAGGNISIELSHYGTLTVQQAGLLGLRPCPRCEQRIISADMAICLHCAGELERQRTNQGFALFVCGFLICTALCLHPAEWFGLEGSERLAVAMVSGFFLAGFVYYGVWRANYALRQFLGMKESER